MSERKALLIRCEWDLRGLQSCVISSLSWENELSSASKWPHPAALCSPGPKTSLHLSLTSSAWPAPQMRDMGTIIAAGTGTRQEKSTVSRLRNSELWASSPWHKGRVVLWKGKHKTFWMSCEQYFSVGLERLVWKSELWKTRTKLQIHQVEGSWHREHFISAAHWHDLINSLVI